MAAEILLMLIGTWVFVAFFVGISRYKLLKSTWDEPYFSSVPFVIESDDWGPGTEKHILGLKGVSGVLASHSDSRKKKAVLTANIILTVPNSQKIIESGFKRYFASTLPDDYGDMLSLMQRLYGEGLFFPQLHGLAHYNPRCVFSQEKADNPIVKDWIANSPCDWEDLPHPLQAHYIDGSILPSRPAGYETQKAFVESSFNLFKKAFGFESKSSVAPCYLWNDTTEKLWSEKGIRYIQTAGYRCIGLNERGNYVQDPKIIRIGENNVLGQIYLVRTVMFEPKDDSEAEKRCIKGIIRAVRQGLPVVVSTHRYNYVGGDDLLKASLNSLDRIISFSIKRYGNLMFMNTVELGERVLKNQVLSMGGLVKLAPFLCRIWYRHKKIRLIGLGSLLLLPGMGVVYLSRLYGMLSRGK